MLKVSITIPITITCYNGVKSRIVVELKKEEKDYIYVLDWPKADYI